MEGRIGSVMVYGINEGLYPDQGKFFLSFEASIRNPKIVKGNQGLVIHPLREGMYVLSIPVSGPDLGFTVRLDPGKS